ncbi:MAG: glycosyltransferase [Firmicutes bacterium]|nr:glycosyltransferase [Bacillota bacterium]
MKALVLSVSTGQGHHATGKAVADCFERYGVQCEILDAYGYVEPVLQSLLSKGYLISTKYIPKISSKAYDWVVKKTEPRSDYNPLILSHMYIADELQEFIQKYQPDIVVCTHVLSSIMMSILKEQGQYNGIVAGVVTDFTVHPLWEETEHIDYYVTPSMLLEYQMRRKGLAVEKILPFGIPIRPEFSEKRDQREARELLGLDPEKHTILLMGGSMGYGKIDKTLMDIDQLGMDVQILVVCGNNQKMFRKITKIQPKLDCDVRVYGFVDNVHEMMDAADCIITKPGGITSSEAQAKGLPMIMVNPIPGQEERNVEFLLNNGMAVNVTKTFSVAEAVFSLFRHPETIEHMKDTVARRGKKHAAEHLCQFLMEQVEERHKNENSTN